MSRILIVAAEASSSLYALRLLEYFQSKNTDVSCFGVGSRDMENAGFQCFGYAEEMAVVGMSEVISHYAQIKAVYQKILAEVDREKPKVALLLDYPGFNLRLAKDLKKRGIKVIYYISPQIWAWKKDRIKTVQKYVDKMLVVLPFEESFYRQNGVEVEFVGHPIVEEIDPQLFSAEQQRLRQGRVGIPDKNKVIGFMPGSRKGELDKHIDVQIAVAEKLYKKHPNLTILFMAAPTLSKEDLSARLENISVPYILLKDEPFKMIQLCDFVLVASGTATLMVALMEKPMVIMYRLSFLTALIARMVVSGFFGLPNLIMNRMVVPEVFQGEANPDKLAQLLGKLIEDPVYAAQVKADLHQIREKLGEKGATQRVAEVLQGYLL